MFAHYNPAVLTCFVCSICKTLGVHVNQQQASYRADQNRAATCLAILATAALPTSHFSKTVPLWRHAFALSPDLSECEFPV